MDAIETLELANARLTYQVRFLRSYLARLKAAVNKTFPTSLTELTR